MPRQNNEYTRHNINLRAGDYAYLQEHCMNEDYDASHLIRGTISQLVDALRNAKASAQNPIPDVEVDL